MLKYFNKKIKKGQSTLEFAILIIIILAALLSVQSYIKRGIQGRLKSATDDIGDQYSVGNMNMVKKSITQSQTRDTFSKGVTRSQLLQTDVSLELVNSQVLNGQYEYWGN